VSSLVVATTSAVAAAYGTFLAYTAVTLGWQGVGVGPPTPASTRRRLSAVLVGLGLDRLRPAEFVAGELVVVSLATSAGYLVFGGWPAALVVGLAAGCLPVAGARRRARQRREAAHDEWPRLLEEVRLHCVMLGRSVPQALFDAGRRTPDPLRDAFAASEREWLLTTDLGRALAVLKRRLADATADTVCETLLVVHQVGGDDIDLRLRALTDDRAADLRARKDARAHQAAVRFARWFVLVVPAGMALVGLGIGEGRDAFGSATGQLFVLLAFAVMAACWAWAAQLLRLPVERRVFGAASR